jgi:UDP-N-acetylmuramate dehydrogenase
MDLLEAEQDLRCLVKGNIVCGESMQKHTSWRIGGPADIIAFPVSEDDIISCYKYAREKELPLTVVGNGSNMLVRDKGIRGIVLKISHGFNNVVIGDTFITAEAGALLPLVAKKAAEAGLSGLEFAAGIPASVGGAVIMNAGAHNKSMAEVVQEVTVLTRDGEISKLSGKDLGLDYRKSSIKENGLIVLKAVFSLIQGKSEEIKAKTESNLAKRRISQPLEYPNAGSVFANPPGQWAGWLIERVGAKGMKVGGAIISEKHANFIVNTGAATAEDVLGLVDKIRQMVLEKYDIELNLEVRVIGE